MQFQLHEGKAAKQRQPKITMGIKKTLHWEQLIQSQYLSGGSEKSDDLCIFPSPSNLWDIKYVSTLEKCNWSHNHTCYKRVFSSILWKNPGQCFLSILGGGLVMLLWYFRGQVVHLQGVQGCFFLSVELLTMLQAVGPSLERQIKVPIFLSMFLRRREIRSFPQTFTLLLLPPPNKYICIKMYLSCSQINNYCFIEIL